MTRAEDKGYEVPVYQELRGVPTAVCCMGACVVVMCKKPTHGEPSNGPSPSFFCHLEDLNERSMFCFNE